MNAPTTFPDTTTDLALQPTGRSDGWTPDRQRTFLDALAGGLHVEHACRVVGLSPSSAYALRQRSRGAAFALGWDAALLLQRQRIVDDLTARAVQGHVTTITRGDGSTTERHQYDNRLSTYMLTRLDRLAEHTDDGKHDQAHAARLAAGEWDQYLDLVAADAGPMATAQFLRHRDTDDAIASVRLAREDRYLRTGTGCAKEVATDDLDLADRANWTAGQWARADAAGLLVPAPRSATAHKPPLPPVSPVEEDEPVWWCSTAKEYRTSFPPTDDFDGYERGEYGDYEYERELADNEADAIVAVLQGFSDPEARERAQAATKRDEWFDDIRYACAEERAARGNARKDDACHEDRAAMDPTPASDVPPTPAGTGPATGDDTMSIFGKIKDAIFGHKTAAPAPAPAAPHPQPTNAPPAHVAPTAAAPAPAQAVDVEAVLSSVAQGKGNPNLNWRTSIVDLMKLLDLDSSLSNREELATELGYTGAKNGSAEMNMWLSKAVMRELEKNGGKVPANLKD